MKKVISILTNLVILVLSIVATVLLVNKNPAILFLTIPGMCIPFMLLIFIIGSFFTVLSIPKPTLKVVPANVNDLKKKLLSLSSLDSPLFIENKGNKFTFSWKLADAKWYDFFSKHELKENYKLYVKLDQKQKVAYVIEVITTYTSSKGFTLGFLLSYFKNFKFFRGWTFEDIKLEKTYGIKENLDWGKVYEINFNSKKFREPVLSTIINNGWNVQPCVISLNLGI